MDKDEVAPSPAAKDSTVKARAEAARLMGSVKSETKAAKARENGKLGGRKPGTPQTPETRAKIAAAVRAKAAERKRLAEAGR